MARASSEACAPAGSVEAGLQAALGSDNRARRSVEIASLGGCGGIGMATSQVNPPSTQHIRQKLPCGPVHPTQRTPTPSLLVGHGPALSRLRKKMSSAGQLWLVAQRVLGTDL